MESHIANIVATTEIGVRIDLDQLRLGLPNCEYEPEVYHALIYRLRKPRTSILVNASGRIIFVGAKSLEDIETARQLFFNDLTSMGYRPNNREISIQNIVVVCEVGHKLDIQRILRSNTDLAHKYNPDVFPGVIYRNSNPTFVALVFTSGKVCVVGLKDPNSIRPAIETVKGIVCGSLNASV